MGFKSKISLFLLAVSGLMASTSAQITDGAGVFAGGDLGELLVNFMNAVTLVEIDTTGQAALFLAVVGVFYYASINIFEQVFLRLEEIIVDAMGRDSRGLHRSDEYPTGVKGMAFAVAFLSANGITGLIGLAIANILGLIALTIILVIMLKLLGIVGNSGPDIDIARNRNNPTPNTTSTSNNQTTAQDGSGGSGSSDGILSNLGSLIPGRGGSNSSSNTPSAGIGSNRSKGFNPADHAGQNSSSSSNSNSGSSSSSSSSGSTPSAGLGSNRSNKFNPADQAGGGSSSSSESIFSRAGTSISSIIDAVKGFSSTSSSDWWNSSDKKFPGIGSNRSNKFNPGNISDDLEDAEAKIKQAYKNADSLKGAISDVEVAIQLIGDSEKELDQILQTELNQLQDAADRLEKLYEIETDELNIEEDLEGKIQDIHNYVIHEDLGDPNGPSVREVFENIKDINDAVLEGLDRLYQDLDVEKDELRDTLEEINQIAEELKFSIRATNKIQQILENEEKEMKDIYNKAKQGGHLSEEFKRDFKEDENATSELETRFEELKSREGKIISDLDSVKQLLNQEEEVPQSEFMEIKRIYSAVLDIDHYISKCLRAIENDHGEDLVLFTEANITDEDARNLYNALREERERVEQEVVPHLERLGIIEGEELALEEQVRMKVSKLLDELR